MNDISTRLTQCFQHVFPGLSEEQIRSATPQTVAEWDSIAAISLVNVIEEEFNVTIEFEDVVNLDSFDAIAQYLKERMPVAG
jgi:acyl carrier protein